MSRFIGWVRFTNTRLGRLNDSLADQREKRSLGGYSGEVPPLPIPNREVKLTNADGTALIVWESR